VTFVYFDSAVVPAGEARLSAEAQGVLFGRGVYETFRARRGAVFLIDRHLRRLRDGAAVVGIDVPEAVSKLAEIVCELTERCDIDDARVRLTLAAGIPGGPPSLLIQARPATDYPESLYERGTTAVVSEVRRNETSPLSRVKSLNILDSIMTREAAAGVGADTSLLLNTRGDVAEASTANIFIVRNGAILTPPVKDGALPGVTRSVLLEQGREVTLSLDDILAADEAFLTGAVMGVMPLVRINDMPIGDAMPGAVTRATRAKYQRLSS
jgi:branched-chain amino acid aminotransferase